MLILMIFRYVYMDFSALLWLQARAKTVNYGKVLVSKYGYS